MILDPGLPIGTSVRLSIHVGKDVTRVRGSVAGRSKIIGGEYRYDVREDGGTIHSNLSPDRLLVVKPGNAGDIPQ